MPIIKCPECGSDVSDQATVCMHCGYPIKKKQRQKQSRFLSGFCATKDRIHARIHKDEAESWFHYLFDSTHFVDDFGALGCLLTALAVLVVVGGGVAFVIWFMFWLFNRSPGLAIVVLLVGLCTFSFLDCYVWSRKNRWFPWLMVIPTMAAIIASIYYA